MYHLAGLAVDCPVAAVSSRGCVIGQSSGQSVRLISSQVVNTRVALGKDSNVSQDYIQTFLFRVIETVEIGLVVALAVFGVKSNAFTLYARRPCPDCNDLEVDAPDGDVNKVGPRDDLENRGHARH
ncbi:hypothetical protein ElyMa_004983300 [Elysia marginata]|uniref:Uncharacterized protein n=1 Tax=Elysia marginata TaxID=1093978 RepID=A0AAV4J927_9GAST|nr:hypothetical protein ElyMa_004983300 [Elysia marginata]